VNASENSEFKPLRLLRRDRPLDRALAAVAGTDYWATPSRLLTPGQIAAWVAGDYSVSAAEMKVNDRKIGMFYSGTGLFTDARAEIAANYSGDFAILLPGGSSMGNQIVGRFFGNAGIHSVLLGRNLHHSMLDSCIHERITFCFVDPGYHHLFEALLPPTPDQVAGALRQHGDVRAVVITSPTYEGLTADVAEIARVVHSHHPRCLLVVDAAWGAHHPFSKELPASPLALGADLIVTSCHKCGGGIQSSALLVGRRHKGRLDDDGVALLEAAHSEIATTSPPAFVLTSIVASQEELTDRGDAHINRLLDMTAHLRSRISAELGEIEILDVHDKTKVTLSLAELRMSGYDLRRSLLRSRIIPEKCGRHSITFLATFQLEDDAPDRLMAALKQHVEQAPSLRKSIVRSNPFGSLDDAPTIPPWITRSLSNGAVVPLADAAGMVAAQRLELYPPGIPTVVPGFAITPSAVEDLLAAEAEEDGGSITTAGPWSGKVAVVPVEKVQTYLTSGGVER
jgi:arginine decarboxylase